MKEGNVNSKTKPTDSAGPADAKDAYSGTASVPEIANLAVEWFKSHLSLIQNTSTLVFADARLAATSSIQLVALGIAFVILLLCTWMALMLAVAAGAHALGMSIAVIATVVLFLHVVLLGILGWSIKSTLHGLRFTASRTAISQPLKDAQQTAETKDV